MNLWSVLIEYLTNLQLLVQTATLLTCLISGGGLTWLIRYFLRYRAHRKGIAVNQTGLSAAPLIAGITITVIVLLLRRGLSHNELDFAISSLSLHFLTIYLLLLFLRFSAIQGIAHLPISRHSLDFLSRIATNIFWGAVFLYILNLWVNWIALLQQASITLSGRDISIFNIAEGLFLIVVTIVIAIWLSTLINKILMHTQVITLSTRMILSRFARVLIVFIALLLGLSFSGLDLTVLSFFGGALGIGLGLGLQRIVSNYMSGLIILLDKSVQINDYIMVDKYEGVVKEVNARYSIVCSLQGVESIIPNETLVLQGVRNYSFSHIPARVSTTFYLSVSSDINAALALAISTMTSVRRVLTQPLPEAFLVKVLPMAYEIELGFWLADYHRGTGDVKSEVNLAILQAWKNAGFELAQYWDINTLLTRSLGNN